MSTAGISAARSAPPPAPVAKAPSAKVNDHDADDMPAAVSAAPAAAPAGQGQVVDVLA